MQDFSPSSFTILEFLNPLAFAVLVSFVLASIYVTLGNRDAVWQDFVAILKTCLICSIPIAMLGYATGFLTGISRSPAVGTVIPGVLALVGGFAVYIFGTDNAGRGPVAFSIVILVVTLFYGVQSGGLEREIHRADRLKALFEVESRLTNYRKNKGLPDKAPDWLLIGETTK